MITNSKEILQEAKKNKKAIPQFNINNLEWTKFILEECNKNNSPVILGISESAIKYMGGYKLVSNLIKNLDEEFNLEIPVVIHLDHGSSIENCKKAIDNGFTSVMYDGSNLPIEENIKNTKEVVEYAEKYNVSVEAEIGIIGLDKYAKIDDCRKLVEETNIDSLAPAVGSIHGIYKEDPKLNFDLIKEISTELNIPLVLHGGSGIPDRELKKAIECGITKLNINTELQIKWSESVREYLKNNHEVYDPRIIIKSGENSLKEVVKQKIELLNK